MRSRADRADEPMKRGTAQRLPTKVNEPADEGGAPAPTGGAGASIKQRSNPNRVRFGSFAKAIHTLSSPTSCSDRVRAGFRK
jgi:hypothetical protein